MWFSKYVYSASGHMADTGDLICGTYKHIHASYMSLKDVIHVYSVEGTFVFDTYVRIICEVDVAICCVLAHICTNARSICPCKMRAV